VYTRLEPTGAIIITMARRHEDDLVGRILASEQADQWTVLRLPALAEADDPLGRQVGEALCPQRFDEAAYAKMRKVMGEASFAALQQQRPSPASGLIFKEEWVRYYTTRDHPIIEDGRAVPFLPERFSTGLQSWDMSFKDAMTSDFVAGTGWKRLGANFYLLPRAVHERLDFPATIKEFKKFTQIYPELSLKLVEDKANGPAVVSTLKNSITGIVAVEPDGDKVARASAVTAAWEAGQVWLPHPSIAPWVKSFVLEHLQFPMGANDDWVDSETQAVRRFMHQLEIEERQRQHAARQTGSTSMRTTRL
jgi:predicted phage terminase large subunit-like protein